jgi:hypothetical protein
LCRPGRTGLHFRKRGRLLCVGRFGVRASSALHCC